MEITEVKVKLMEEKRDRLQAFCTITLDNEFVIRDLKIIEGAKGFFVAMPSRKLTDKCPKCSGKNHLRSKFCADCGARLNENRAPKDERGRAKLHADIAHPINQACRERMQAKIVEAFKAEMERSKQPGYVPTALYEDEEVFAEEEMQENTAGEIPMERRPERQAPVIEPREPEQHDDRPARRREEEQEDRPVKRRDEPEEDGFGKGIFS
jgi:stage V sporulation protein G